MRTLYLLIDMYLIDSEVTVTFESIAHSDYLTFTLPVANLFRVLSSSSPKNSCNTVPLSIHGVVFFVPLPTYYELRRQFDKLTK